MSANARLCTLSHLYFYSRTCVQISLVNTETTRCNLNNGVFAVAVKILMQSALACIVADSEKLGGLGEAFVSVVAD